MLAVVMHACMTCEMSDCSNTPARPASGTKEENDYLSPKRWLLNSVSSLITCMYPDVRNEYRILIQRGERKLMQLRIVFKIQHDRRKRPGLSASASDFRASLPVPD